ncbi:hypothetical protein N431DRAFT_562939 [Stipitochalara longipes BDJ]|nr:hypothetical protein N431DRAFT_562939 [Stipitochalara longipes BDJ]
MAPNLPSRLLGHTDGNFFVFDPRSYGGHVEFDIISYTWGDPVDPYKCGINGISWEVTINPERLDDIKRLMVSAGVQYLWADCVCINQTDTEEKSVEISKMYEYYKNARKCHILVGMAEVWDPQEIVNNLKFLDHVLSYMRGAALSSDAVGLTANLANRLSGWANKDWNFPVGKDTVRSTGIDMGVLNCYSTSIKHVRSLFKNSYFSRMWTFQEMILGKNVTMWGVNHKSISRIGELHVWMDLATDSKDKAYKLQEWIEDSRVLKSGPVSAILRIIEQDKLYLNFLQTQVEGISGARTDIINGGPNWWRENFKGISNIFSAVSITPRKCGVKADIFRGLLGIFSGLFTPEEIKAKMSGNDIDTISFNFFKQLSTKTGYAWTKLALSSREREEWGWIPVVENYNSVMTTDCFAGVVNLGRLRPKGREKGQIISMATTGIEGVPRKYMNIVLSRQNTGFQFIFKGCNCGKKQNTGFFSSELIPTHNQPRNVVKDETGRILVQCATILGSIMDPGCNIVQYRRKLLGELQPRWTVSDPSAKPIDWINRCVSGTPWENPNLQYLRAHNMSMNYQMIDITDCDSRLANESTESISCEVRVNCGCTITAPFAFLFEAITAVEGSFLGDTTATLDEDNRIVLKDGLGLVQVGDVNRTFKMVAFGGDINAHKSYASSCRNTKPDKPVVPKLPWPKCRALVREEFTHDATDMLRDYGYFESSGSGNLLLCRKQPLDMYKIIGVCIDEFIPNKKGNHAVNIR